MEGLRCRSRHDKVNTDNTNQKSTLIKTKGNPKEIPTTKINGLTFHKLNVLFDTGSSNVNLISNHLVKHLSLKLQPEGFKRKILTAIGSKLVQYQYIDLNIRRNDFTVDPILRQVRFLHSEEQEVNLGRGNSPSLIAELDKHLNSIDPKITLNINKPVNEEIHLLISSEFIRKFPTQTWWTPTDKANTSLPVLTPTWFEIYVGPKL